MPFEDEGATERVVVHPYRASWATEAAALSAVLARAVPSAVAVEHIGSTSVPGMAAKDCLDLMLVVTDLGGSGAGNRLTRLGYRRRPEPWNNTEPAAGTHWPKMTFAPPVGGRAQNLHVRTAGSATTRLALLFRDHLRASPTRTAWWSELKTAAAAETEDLTGYGRIKYPAWCLLMELAETWAHETGWQPPTYGTAR